MFTLKGNTYTKKQKKNICKLFRCSDYAVDFKLGQQWLPNNIMNSKWTHLDKLMWTSEGCSLVVENKKAHWYWAAHRNHQNQQSPGLLCFGFHSVKKCLTVYFWGSQIKIAWDHAHMAERCILLSKRIPLFASPISCISEPFGKGIVVNF